MKNVFTLIVIVLLFTACNGSSNRSSGSSNNDAETVTEDTYEAQRNGHRKGYEDGYSDGYGWIQSGVSYNDRNSYTTDEGITAYKNGYRDGYEEGYEEGKSRIIAEREQNFYIYHNDNGEVYISHSQAEEDEYQRRKAQQEAYRQQEEARQRNDFHNWENEDVVKFYAQFSAYNDEDAESKHYFYKEVDGLYFYSIELGFDAYEIEIEKKVASKFYKVKGSNVYLEFRYEPYLYKYDEGVLDCANSSGTFYKKPD